MQTYEIDTQGLRSMSVSPDEVCAVELSPGESLWCRGKRLSWDVPVVCIVDRLGGTSGHPTCTMVRQTLELSNADWGQNYTKPSPSARDRARRAGYPRVTVPGGIPPLTNEGTIAIPDFSMSGTNWYIVPATAS